MKYVAGQQVMISNELHRDMPSPGVNHEMMELKGKVTKVKRVIGDYYKLEIDRGSWSWTESMLEPVTLDTNELLDMLISGSINEEQYKKMKKQT